MRSDKYLKCNSEPEVVRYEYCQLAGDASHKEAAIQKHYLLETSQEKLKLQLKIAPRNRIRTGISENIVTEAFEVKHRTVTTAKPITCMRNKELIKLCKRQ